MRIGIDLGGTKTEIICLNADNGTELYRKRVSSPRDNYAETIKTMAHLVAEAERELGRKGTLGVGIPGTVSISTFLGPVTRLVVRTEVGELIVDAVSRPGLPGLGEATTVALDDKGHPAT